MGAAGIEPDVDRVVDLAPFRRIVDEPVEEAVARVRREPGVDALALEDVADALVDPLVAQYFDAAVGLLAHEQGERHAPHALA